MEIPLRPVFSYIRKGSVLCEGFQVSIACRSDKISVKKKKNMEHWWNETDRGKTMYYGTN